VVEALSQDRIWVHSQDSAIGEAVWRPSVEKRDLIHWQSALRSPLQAQYAEIRGSPIRENLVDGPPFGHLSLGTPAHSPEASGTLCRPTDP
jgi:hypothetical protein